MNGASPELCGWEPAHGERVRIEHDLSRWLRVKVPEERPQDVMWRRGRA